MNTSAVVPINSYIVKVASRCNLDCVYCYEYNMGDGSWQAMPRFMSQEIVNCVALRIREHCQLHGIDEIYVNLHGGEPLLFGKSRTRQLLELFTDKLRGIRLHWGVQTNGTLLDPEWVDLFEHYSFSVGLSLDGPAEVNDVFRVNHQGCGSHAQVMKGVRHLQNDQGRRIFSGLLAVVNPRSDPLAVFHHFLEIGPKAMDFLLPHGNWDEPPMGKSPNPSASTRFADWLIPIFDDWLDNHSGRVGIRTFEEIIEHLAGGPGRLETIGLQPVSLIVVAVNGDIEGVDTLKSIPGQQHLGLNVQQHTFEDALAHPMYRLRQEGINSLSETCQACPLVGTCGGGYLPHRWSSDQGFQNPSVYCADLTKLIFHIRSRVWETVQRQPVLTGAGEVVSSD